MQPAPKPNDTQPIHEQVIEDIKRRAEVGKQNYGTYLQVNNGRDSLLDAYEEAQDKALYLKQAILERDALVMELEVAREELRRLTQANADLRKERDRAVAEAQRQDGVAKGLRKERDQLAADNARLRAALDRAFEGAARQLAEPRHHGNDQYALTDIATTCELALAAHDAALLREVVKLLDPDGGCHEALMAEADRIEKEAKNK